MIAAGPAPSSVICGRGVDCSLRLRQGTLAYPVLGYIALEALAWSREGAESRELEIWRATAKRELKKRTKGEKGEKGLFLGKTNLGSC